MPDQEPFPRPENSIGGGLQHERTALAWERTAVAMMVAGVVLARYATQDTHVFLSVGGLAQTVAGASLLWWAARHHEQLHSLATPASAVPQVGLTRLIGGGAVLFTGFALVVVAIGALG